MIRKPVRAGLLMAVVGLIASLVSTGGANAATTLPLRAISHNMQGASGPNADQQTSEVDLFNVTRHEVENFAPQVVMLQEVCYARELPYFRSFTNPLGYQSTFTSIRTDYTACLSPTQRAAIRAQYHLPADGDVCAPNPSACYYGEVLAVKGTLSNRTETYIGGNYEDSYSPQRRFRLLCGDVRVAGVSPVVHACTTHLRAHTDPRPNDYAGCHTNGDCSDSTVPDACAKNDRCSRGIQTRKIASLLGAEANSKIIVFGGDLNTTPGLPQLDPFYRPSLGGTGNYYEADQTDGSYYPSGCGGPSCRSGSYTVRGGDETFTLKYDYVFFQAPTLTDLTGLSARCGYDPKSDHGIYRAQVQYKHVGADAPGAAPYTKECGT